MLIWRTLGGSPPRGVGPSHLHKRCHCITSAGRLAVPGGGRLGRPAVVPPAGRGSGLGAPLPGRWGREGGALSSKAPRKVRPARRSSPTGSAPGLGAAGSETQPDVGCWWVRTKWTRSLPGGGPPRGQPRRMEAPTVPMFVPAVALDHSDHALSEPKKRAK